MAGEHKTLLTYSIALILLTLSSSSMASHSPDSQVIKGGYYASWMAVDPSTINSRVYTHIYYAFLTPSNVTFKFTIDVTQAIQLLNFTSTLHTMRPPVKTLFSVGGAAEGTDLFSRLASSRSNRANFVRSSIEVARKFGFDGIDLDWEFPQTADEMLNLDHLLNEWRVEVQKEAAATNRPPLLITAATYYSADIFLSGPPRAYPSASITKNLDWINVMNYDYYGAWDTSATGAQAALFNPINSNISTSFGLGSWVRAGVPRSKVIMGLPLYGRTWRLRDPAAHGVGAAAIDVGPGPERSGVLTYAEVVQYNRDNDAKEVHDLDTVSAYSVSGDVWIGYDDVKTVTAKIAYARALGLRGYFFWAIHGDYKGKISKTASKLWSC